MLSRGQHIVIDEKIADFTNEAVDLRLQPGKTSLHSFRSIHASGRTKLIIQELVLPSAIVLLIYNVSLALLRKNLQCKFPISSRKRSFIMNLLQVKQWALKKF